MRTTLKIAKTELQLLFYSPIAWILLAVFLFQSYLSFTSFIGNVVMNQGLDGTMPMLTRSLYSTAFASDIVEHIYLYLPLLTMGIMSKEFSSGTIKLLYSSPIKVHTIVIGKFISLLLFNLAFLLIIAIPMLIGVVYLPELDYGVLFSILLGIFLLLMAYSSIGLFLSCLTSYQIVAAISTFAMFAALKYVGEIWQGIDFVRDLTYFLSVNRRIDNFFDGLISSKDLIYFFAIAFMFLSFSIILLKGGREVRSIWNKLSLYTLVVVTVLTVGYLSSRPQFTAYLDLEATKENTLTLNAQKIVKGLDKAPLEVVSYINLLDMYYNWGTPEQRNRDMRRWERYLRFQPYIKFKYVYYYDTSYNYGYLYRANAKRSIKEIAEKQVRAREMDLEFFKSPSEIKKIIDLRPEENRYVIQLKYKGDSTFLRLSDDQIIFPTEMETAAALKRLQVNAPKIIFIQSEHERNIEKLGDKDYKMMATQISFRYSLVNQGFEVNSVSLDHKEIPVGVSTLVIADPRKEFSKSAQLKIQKYIAAGGNLLIMGEPGKQSVLNPIVERLGLRFMDGTLVEESRDFPANFIHGHLTQNAGGLSKRLMRNFKKNIPVYMTGSAGLTYEKDRGFEVRPLIVTDGQTSWNRKGKLVLDSTDVVFDPAEGDEKQSIAIGLALTRRVKSKEQRIVVFGDADVLNNQEMSRTDGKSANFNLNMALFSWFTYDQFPIDVSRPDAKDKWLNLNSNGVRGVKILLLGILPGLMILGGTVLLIRRKRK